MEDTLVGPEVAKLAKEKGFNAICRHAYKDNNNIPINFDNGCCYDILSEHYTICPTQSLLQKWLREKHNIIVIPNYGDLSNKFSYDIVYKDDYRNGDFLYKTYEEALEIGLIEGLKEIKLL